MRNRYAWIVGCCILLFSCNSGRKEPAPVTVPEPAAVKAGISHGQVIAAVPCQANPAQTYALYLPTHYSDTGKFPVMIFFDPHGDGSLPLTLYRSLAERYGTIMVGSNNCKNGLSFQETNAIADMLITECAQRYSSDTRRISLAGFSGGAKVALVAASNHAELLTVIYCGAVVPFDGITRLPPALGIAGQRDLNYTEVGYSSRELYEKNIHHSFIEWDGKHEWPDTVTFEDVFYWNEFQAMRMKSIPMNPERIDAFTKKMKMLIAHQGSTIDKVNACTRAASFLYNLADVTDFQKRLEEMSRTERFQSEMKNRQNLMLQETNLKTSYGQCFDSKDLAWWQQEIKRMSAVKGEQELMYQRLLGFLSLAAYSYSSGAIRQNNLAAAQRYLGIYKLADPENPEQPFLEACVYAREGNPDKAIAALQAAISLGLKDRTKIEMEESFLTLRGQAAFNNLMNQL